MIITLFKNESISFYYYLRFSITSKQCYFLNSSKTLSNLLDEWIFYCSYLIIFIRIIAKTKSWVYDQFFFQTHTLRITALDQLFKSYIVEKTNNKLLDRHVV